MQRVKRMFSSAIMSRRHCLESCYLLFSCFLSLSAGSGEVSLTSAAYLTTQGRQAEHVAEPTN